MITQAFDWIKQQFNTGIFKSAQADEVEQFEFNIRKLNLSAYYIDSLISLKNQPTPIDTKWMAAPPIDAIVRKTPAPNLLTVAAAKKLMEETSPALEKSAEVAKMLESENLEEKIKHIANAIDEELKKSDRNFEKLQTYIYALVMGLMHKYKKVDQEYILESGAQIKIQAVKVQSTYNTWPAVAITLVSSAVGIVGGAAGLAPLAPISWINADTARIFAGASQSIGTAGTGLGGVGSIFNSKGESVRFVYQIDLEEIKKKREDKEGSKHQKAQRGNEARSNAHEHDKLILELLRSILNA